MPPEYGLRDINVNEISLMIKILHGTTSLAEISRQLDITLQGVRYYVGSLRERGYMNDMTLTQEGYEHLIESLKILKKFVVDNSEAISDSLAWECIGDEDIKQNTKLFLEMRGGFLHGSLKGADDSATAIAMEPALKGRRVRIRDIRGIIKINFGTVHARIIENLTNANYTDYKETLERELQQINAGQQIFLLGEGAMTLFPNSGYNKFSSLSGAFEAASKGIDSVIVSTRESWNLNDEQFNELLKKNGSVKVNVTSVKI